MTDTVKKILRLTASLLLTGLTYSFVFIPLHGRLSLNLVAALEPYIQYTYYFRAVQVFIILFSRYLFVPFFLYVSYRIARKLIAGEIPRFELFGKKPGHRLKRLVPGRLSVFLTVPWFGITFLLRSLKFLYFTLCGSVVVLESLFGLILVYNTLTHPTGAIAFYRNCDQCHGFNRPFNFNHSAKIWELTVDRMYRHAPDMGKSLPFDKREAIIEFLVSVRSYSDKRLVRSKCYTCHTPFRIFSTSRTAEEWGLLTDRVHKENMFYITERQRDQIMTYLASREDLIRESPDPLWDPEAKVRFERKCSICHTLDIVLMPHIEGEDWPDVLHRMGEKQPTFLSSEASLSLLPLVETAVANPGRFPSDFPHSTMRESTHE